jgi:hypothetical protein
LDFLAYNAGESSGSTAFSLCSLYQNDSESLIRGIYGRSDQAAGARFFTTDLDEFCRGLDWVQVNGDEASFVALDTALDYPWREIVACHRVIVLMTDEALETGVYVRQQLSAIPNLIEKIHALRVKLFLIGPSSSAFDQICAADRSEYQVMQDAHDGLKNSDFTNLLGEIGKSVSVSTLQAVPTIATIRKALFGQDTWVAIQVRITGS